MKTKKMMMIKTVMAVMLALVTLSSCTTDVELCDSPHHPHLAKVKFEFNWGAYEKDIAADDSMYVIADRVINHWKAAMKVSPQNPVRGRFMFNGPETPPDAKPAVSQTGTLTEFQIRPGDYKLIAFRVNDEEMIYSDVDKYLMDETGMMNLQDIYGEYKVYSKGEEGLRKTLVDWQDYNPYAQYIQPDICPVFYDTLTARRIGNGATVKCRFSPRPVTQHIDINFAIKKKLNLVGKGKENDVRFFVDSVWIEMSGVPREINLANGYLKIDRTCKVMTKADEIKDSETSTFIKVCGSIDVPSIVQNNTSDVSTGPGILQVIIFTHSVVYDEKGNVVSNPSESDGIAKKKKKIQGKINLYNTLRHANLMTVTSDGRHAIRNGAKGVLNIVADIVIDGKNILENDDNTGGIDPWKDCTDRIIVDI